MFYLHIELSTHFSHIFDFCLNTHNPKDLFDEFPLILAFYHIFRS